MGHCSVLFMTRMNRTQNMRKKFKILFFEGFIGEKCDLANLFFQ